MASACRRIWSRTIKAPLPAAQSLQNPARFLPAAAAQFRHRHLLGNELRNFAGMALQHPFVGPGQAVLGQQADHLEQSRAHIVIKIF